jgi:hypothetical protein
VPIYYQQGEIAMNPAQSLVARLNRAVKMPGITDAEMAALCREAGIDARGLESTNVHVWAIALPRIIADVAAFAAAGNSKLAA